MKTWIFSMCLGIYCLISAQSMAQSFPFKISGKINNISPMPTKMYLTAGIKGVLNADSDSTAVVNGEYIFTGELKVDEAIIVMISSEPKYKPDNSNGYALFVDKGELDVVSEGAFKNISVTGSAATAQHEHDDITKAIDKEKEDLERITKTDQYKTDQQLQADVLKRSRSLAGKGITDTYAFVKNNPDKRSAPAKAYLLAYILPKGKPLDTILSSLPEHVKNDPLGKQILHLGILKDSLLQVAKAKNKMDAGKVQVGAKAPDINQPDVNNKSVSLSSFKGKYVLVDFWASWCMPCRAENPNVVKAYQKYKDKGFTILGVSLDAQASRSAWIKAIAADGLSWTEVADLKGWKNEAAVTYGVSSIPQNFLIDPNGVVIAKDLRGDDLNTKLAALFK